MNRSLSLLFKNVFLFAIILLGATAATGQQRWFEFTTGAAISFGTKENNPSTYNFRILPHAGLTMIQPFNDRVGIKTGLIYQQKGLKVEGESVKQDSFLIRNATISRSTYHFVSVPLQLAFNLGTNQESLWRIAGGMSYGFMAKARTNTNIRTYKEDELVEIRSVSFDPLITTSLKDNNPSLPGNEGTPLYLFTPSVRLDVTYQWQERLLLSFFYEYDLQDVHIRTARNARVNLHYTGIALGVKFW
jgi:hypothetical protein